MSEGDRGPLLCAPDAKATLEARNGVEQLDYITELVEVGARELRESHVLELQSIAIRNVYPCGGKYRTALHNVFIAKSPHRLPEAAFVPSLVRDAVDWINRQRGQRSALERAAFALWRFNWIHPFAGGNGRTSRALAYLVVCMDAGRMLPGVPSMPSLIYEHRDDYLLALQRRGCVATKRRPFRRAAARARHTGDRHVSQEDTHAPARERDRSFGLPLSAHGHIGAASA